MAQAATSARTLPGPWSRRLEPFSVSGTCCCRYLHDLRFPSLGVSDCARSRGTFSRCSDWPSAHDDPQQEQSALGCQRRGRGALQWAPCCVGLAARAAKWTWLQELQEVVAARANHHDAHRGGDAGWQGAAAGLRLARSEWRELCDCRFEPASAQVLWLLLGPCHSVGTERSDQDHAPAQVPRHHPRPPVYHELRAGSCRGGGTTRLQWRRSLDDPQVHEPHQDTG
mmetsp:Transcript_102209/g.256263  ORF Transcript_102209/g.256263 Transcript_102209/m.256263 type:complete len:226 (+) Transcript_102209:3-680(+)